MSDYRYTPQMSQSVFYTVLRMPTSSPRNVVAKFRRNVLYKWLTHRCFLKAIRQSLKTCLNINSGPTGRKFTHIITSSKSEQNHGILRAHRD